MIITSAFYSLEQRRLVLLWAVAVTALCSAQVTRAQGTLAYSFESDLQGFTANGANIQSVTQDTFGATNGTKSMKIDVLSDGTYVGALTGALDPNIIGDPPGVISMSFDLTITALYPADGFVDIFPVFFGLQVGTETPAHEVSFQNNRVAIGDLAPGTYPIEMVLDSAFHPIDFDDFSARPFNDIFGVEGSGNPIDLIPTGFQITISKSTHAPWVGYIDNVRFSATEGPAGDLDGNGDINGRDFLYWQRGATSPSLDPGLLAAWQGSYNGGNLTALNAVPEPSSALLALSTVIGIWVSKRRFL